MPKRIHKHGRPAQERLGMMKETVLKDAISREKNIKELAISYGVHPGSLYKFYKENGIKKKRKNVEYESGYTKGCYKKRIEELRDYIKENNFTKEEVISSIF